MNIPIKKEGFHLQHSINKKRKNDVPLKERVFVPLSNGSWLARERRKDDGPMEMNIKRNAVIIIPLWSKEVPFRVAANKSAKHQKEFLI